MTCPCASTAPALPPIRVGEVPPPSSTDWQLVAVTGVALAAVVGGFWLMLENAGRVVPRR